MSDQQRTLLAIVLMALILLLFFSEPYQRRMRPAEPQPAPQPAMEGTFSAPADTVHTPEADVILKVADETPTPASPLENVPESRLVVNTPLMELHLSSLGGGTLDQIYLNDYQLKDSSRVQLIPDGTQGILPNQFIGFEVENFSTMGLPSECSQGAGPDLSLTVKTVPATVSFTVPLAENTYIKRTFTFYPDRFHFDLNQELVGLEEVNAGRYFATSWRSGIAVTEPNVKDDLLYTKLYALLGDDTKPSDYDAKKESKTEITTGLTRWVGLRSKYFTTLMVPEQPVSEFRQSRVLLEGEPSRKTLSFDIRDSFDRRAAVSRSNYMVYVGPIDYDILKTYGLHFEDMINWGWFGFIGKWSLRLFKWLYVYIPNYGIVLIIFSVLVKLLTSPLTRRQLASTYKMQQLQPVINELKEKYKGDPQKLQQEQMKLWKEKGVNPMGGCWPLLIQMPILIAMFRLFRSTIELRGAAFIGLEWWISDLSLPDTVAHIGGLAINPLPIIMSATMILQQKLSSPSVASNPQMKNMPYIMTVMFLFIFYRFPSGLNLYYTLFNVMSILQQKLLPHKALQAEATQAVKAEKKKKSGK